MTENLQPERHSWLKLSILLAFISGYGVLSVVGGGGDTELNLDDPNMVNLMKILQAVGVIILFICPAILFSLFWTNQKMRYLGLHTRPKLSTLLLSGLGMLLAIPLINWLGELNKGMELPEAFAGIEAWMKNSEAKAEQLTEALTKGTSIGVLLANLFVVAFMAALSEEIFFRGILQKVAVECFRNKHVAVWFGAIIFSAFHMQFYGFLPRMLMGAFLGYLFLWSGSLWPSILAHFLNNGMAVYLVWLVNRGSISDSTDDIGIKEGEMLYVGISAVLVVLCLWLVHRKERKRALLP